MEIDGRDDILDPYEGYYARIVQEFAGIGGDTVFGKAEMIVALYQQIWNDLVCVYMFWFMLFMYMHIHRLDHLHFGLE